MAVTRVKSKVGLRKRSKRALEELVLEDDSPAKQYLFVYGTLLSDQPNSERLEGKVTFVDNAYVPDSVLVFHDLPGKQFPFLIKDHALLHRFTENTGIRPFKVHGELYEVTDDRLFVGLDTAEGIVAPLDIEPIPGTPSEPLTNLYQRKKVMVTTKNGEHHTAYVYLANPRKSNIQNLVEILGTKVVIPSGKWGEYYNRRPDNSLRVPRRPWNTFGMETEVKFLVQVDDEQVHLPFLRGSKGYSFTFRDGKRIGYKRLTDMISQALFSSLRRLKSGGDKLLEYYEKWPDSNLRFVTPGGMTYVDGEYFEYRHRPETGARRLFDQRTQLALRTEPGFDARNYRTDVCFLDHFPGLIFIEETGFPTEVTPGFATKYVQGEFVRRYHLADALEDISIVHYNRRKFTSFELTGNSTQYNYVLDPNIRIVRKAGGKISLEQVIDLSTKKVTVQTNDNGKIVPVQESKFTCDVAYVLGKTYGPLLSYILSGSEPGHVDFKTRPKNRLEYRNTVIYDPEQMIAGVTIYVAACRVVEKTIKDYVIEKACQETKKDPLELSRKEVLDVYKTITSDELVAAFPIAMADVMYKPAQFRPGFTLTEQDAYHVKVRESLDAVVNIIIQGQSQQQTRTVRDIISILFNSGKFKDELRNITTIGESQIITDFFTERVPEVYQPSDRILSTDNIKQAWKQSTRSPLSTYYRERFDFPAYVSNFFFKQNGTYTLEDEDHCLTIEMNGRQDHEDSTIYIGSMPLTVTLFKKVQGSSESSKVKVDEFSIRANATNYDKLPCATEGKTKYKVWEVFYKLK